MTLSILINYQDNLDVFSFYPIKNAIVCSEELWFPAICASLRMKHSVLIREVDSVSYPEWDLSKRFAVGDHWCWLSSRYLSSLTEAFPSCPIKYHDLKTFLATN